MPVKLGFIILSIIGVLRIPEEFYLYKDKDKLSRNPLDFESHVSQIVHSTSLRTVRECEHNRNNVQHIQINQIHLTDQIETVSTFPEYTIDQ